jgi:hypothetical protein
MQRTLTLSNIASDPTKRIGKISRYLIKENIHMANIICHLGNTNENYEIPIRTAKIQKKL